jgi:hypothetical protein
MTQRSRVVAVQRLSAKTAGRWFAVVDGVGVIDEGALYFGVPVLASPFVVGRRLGRGAFEGRRVGRRRLGGVGGVLVEPGFEVGQALLVVLDQGKDRGLGSRRTLLPEFVRDWRTRLHSAGVAIRSRLGNLDP